MAASCQAAFRPSYTTPARAAFSGSINETAAAWLENIEQFKVFRSWEPVDAELVEFDRRTFERYWDESTAPVDLVPLPDNAAQRLMSYAPTDIEELNLAEYEKRRRARRDGVEVRLRDYQLSAADHWVTAGHRGILEMATGTGKTKTAAECIARVVDGQGRQLVVVTAPYQHIAVQWREELGNLSPILAFGGTPWKAQVANAISDVKLGRRRQITIVAVQDTAGSDAFAEYVSRALPVTDVRMIVGDEVHGLGAPQTRRALLDGYTHRLGLSATPTRWFDEAGTAHLLGYFGDVVYTFGIKEALEWKDPNTGLSALCPYRYLPHATHLVGEEREEYLELSDKLRYLLGKEDDESKERLEQLLFRRAAIIKTASQKVDVLADILDQIDELRHTLIYCHSMEQMGAVNELLHSRGITYHRFTGEEGTAASAEYSGASERESILGGLADERYQVLVAIKCLDEGVDVPSARIGIILASSSNPREYIQRRGRLLRRAPEKAMADIYDVLVTPDPAMLIDPVIRKMEHDILAKELARVQEFAENASNGTDVQTWLLNLLDGLA